MQSLSAARKIPEIFIDQAIAEVQTIFAHNFFPAMKVNWSVYPDNVGRKIFPGCFRCHDGAHISAAGQTITNDCSCHTIIGQGPVANLGSINPSGLEFKHPVDIGDAWKQMSCTVYYYGAC